MEAKGLPTRDPPETPPALEAAAADLSVTGSKHSQAAADGRGVRARQAPESPQKCGPSQKSFRFYSLLLLCYLLFLGGRDAYGWEVEWEERCLALRGAAEIYGTGFLQAGEGPQAGAVEPDRGANA